MYTAHRNIERGGRPDPEVIEDVLQESEHFPTLVEVEEEEDERQKEAENRQVLNRENSNEKTSRLRQRITKKIIPAV
jgi:hypothetical protein